MKRCRTVIARFPLALVPALAAAAEPVAQPAAQWDRMFGIWLAVAVGIYLVVAVPMLYFLWKYRWRAGTNEVGAAEEAGPGIEVLWTVVPLIIVLFLATQSFALYAQQRTAPADALPVRAEAFMWGWNFQYANGRQSTAELVVPVGKPVKLALSSKDVIHSLHVPAAKVMEDAVPGRVTEMWFQIERAGEYRSFCREYCGTMHAYMQATIKAVPADEFERWLAAN
jgi:cytochrome c oxidase subunit 2